MMVGNANGHAVQPFFLLQHHPVVRIKFRARVTPPGIGAVIGINVANGHDVFSGHPLDVRAAAAIGANAADIEFFIGRFVIHGRQCQGRAGGQRARGQGG
jgi:hypothetical protein